MASIAKLISQNIVWRGLYHLSNFILTLTIARHFEADGSGPLFFITNNCALVVLLMSLSFEAAIIFFSSSNTIEKRKLFWTSILIVIIASILLFLFSPLYYQLKIDQGNSSSFKNIFFFVTGNLIANFMAGFYFADKRFAIPNLVSVIVNGVMIFLLFNPAKWYLIDDSSFINFYFSSFFLQGIILAIIIFISKKDFCRISFFSKEDVSKVYHYLSLVFISNILTFFCYRVDYWFVAYYCSDNELGNYIQVSKLVQLFFVIPSMLATVIFPIVSGGEQNKIKEMIPLLTRLVFSFYAFICIILAIAGFWLFPFVFGKSYSLMHTCFLFYIPGILSFSALYTFSAFNSGRNQVKINLKGCAMALGVALIGNFFTVPRFGINGAALISSFSYFFYFGYVIRVFIKEFGLPLYDFFFLNKKDWIRFLNTINKTQ